jgi:hypothetical protein
MKRIEICDLCLDEPLSNELPHRRADGVSKQTCWWDRNPQRKVLRFRRRAAGNVPLLDSSFQLMLADA